jgi:DNA-directed RNA polymerase subunit F
VSRIPLSNEETRVIFAGEAASNFGALEGSEQQQVINRLVNILENDAVPSSLVHEQIGNLDIYTAGDQIRLYAKVVDQIPRENAEYHVIYLFYIDDDHDYEQRTLATYSSAAEAKAEQATSLATVPDVEAYLEDRDALDADDLRDLR